MMPSARPSFLSHAATAAFAITGSISAGIAGRWSGERLRVPDESRVRVRLEVPRRADHQAVEIFRIPLRFDADPDGHRSSRN